MHGILGFIVSNMYWSESILLKPEMEKRADAADTFVLFFFLSCANFLADMRKLAKTLCYYHCAKSNVLEALCYEDSPV